MTQGATERGSATSHGRAPRRSGRRLWIGIGLLALALVGGGLARYRVHAVTTLALAPLLRPGDTILVRRGAYRGTEPAPWDVVLIGASEALPHVPVVRRIAGVGGERVQVVRGQLWSRSEAGASWRILTRPRAVRDASFVEVFPWRVVTLDAAQAFECEGAWAVVGPGTLRFAGGGVARARYADAITTTSRADVPSALGRPVDDIRVRLDVTPQAPCDVEVEWRAPAGWSVVLTLSTQDGPRAQGLRIVRPGGVSTQTWARGLHTLQTTTVEVIAVDGRVTVRLDDRIVQRVGIGLTAPIPRGTPQPQPQSLRLGARGGSLDVDRVRIDRALGWRGSPRLEGDAGLLVPDHAVCVVSDPGAESLGDLPEEAIVPLADLLGRADYVLLPWARRGTVR